MIKHFKNQKQSLEKFTPLSRTFDMSDPGTGKTRVALDLFVARKNSRAIVIAPLTLMETAWCDDAVKYQPHLVVIPAYLKDREQVFKTNADIIVVNTDATKWLTKQKPAFFRGFDTLIIDESSYFKHRTSARSKALAKIRHHFKYRHAMSGTPMTNVITDIWHQVFLIDDGKRLGTSFFHFRHSTCTPIQVGPAREHVKWEDKPGAAEAVASLLSDISVRHIFEECIDIPKTFWRTVHFTLPPKLRRIYEQFKHDAIIELEEGTVTAVHQAALRTKLLQIASGAVYDREAVKQLLSSARYELTAELVAKRKHSIIFFQWTHQRDELIKELEKKEVTRYAVIDGSVRDPRKRAQIVRDYEAGAYQTLLLHPKSAAHGTTLVRASAVIWPSPTSDLEWWIQGFRRVLRAGQTKKTEVIMVSARDTIEDKLYASRNKKDLRQTSFLEILKT